MHLRILNPTLIHPDAPCSRPTTGGHTFADLAPSSGDQATVTPEAGAWRLFRSRWASPACTARPVTRQVSAKWRRKHRRGLLGRPYTPWEHRTSSWVPENTGAPGGWESQGGEQGWVQGVIYNRRASADVGRL